MEIRVQVSTSKGMLLKVHYISQYRPAKSLVFKWSGQFKKPQKMVAILFLYHLKLNFKTFRYQMVLDLERFVFRPPMYSPSKYCALQKVFSYRTSQIVCTKGN